MEPEPNFEAALKQLEAIVDDLERGEPELSTALSKYEQGVRLLARCHGVLDQAEQSVALLTGVKENGDPITTPFVDNAFSETEAKPAAKPAPKPRKRPPTPAGDGDDPLIPF